MADSAMLGTGLAVSVVTHYLHLHSHQRAVLCRRAGLGTGESALTLRGRPRPPAQSRGYRHYMHDPCCCLAAHMHAPLLLHPDLHPPLFFCGGPSAAACASACFYLAVALTHTHAVSPACRRPQRPCGYVCVDGIIHALIPAHRHTYAPSQANSRVM